MAKARGRDIHRSLSERVARAVAGQGIPRRTIDAAVSRVVAALGGAAASPAAASGPAIASGASGDSAADSIVVAFTASASPDLASRVRAGLAAVQVTAHELGTASAGRHTVVTARVPASARDRVVTVGQTLQLSVTVLDTARGQA